MPDNIDYPLLREQKQTLLKVINRAKAYRYTQEEEDLTGILHLIDGLQDNAVDVDGVDPKQVFMETV